MCAKTAVKASVGQISISDFNPPPHPTSVASTSQCWGGAGREPDRSRVFPALQALSDTCEGLRGEPSGSKGHSLNWGWQWSQRIVRTSSEGDKSHWHFWGHWGSVPPRGQQQRQWEVRTTTVKNTLASRAASPCSPRHPCSHSAFPLGPAPIPVTDSCSAFWGDDVNNNADEQCVLLSLY